MPLPRSIGQSLPTASISRGSLLSRDRGDRAIDITQYLRAVVAEFLSVAPTQIDLETPICPDPRQLLNVVRQPLRRDLQIQLYDCDAIHCQSIVSLARYLSSELEPPPAPRLPIDDVYEGGAWGWGPVRPASPALVDQRLLFILSAPRSGSTLLRAMLSRSRQQLYSPGELHLVPFDTMSERRQKTEALGFGWTLLGLVAALRDLGNLTRQQARRSIAAMEADDLSTGEVYKKLIEGSGHRVLVDKTPGYTFHAQWLMRAEQMCPQALYLHLVRHPTATIESFVRMRFHRLLGRHWLVWDENAWLYAEKVWTSCNLHIGQFLRSIDPRRQLVIRYEDLVQRPDRVLRHVCSFSGIRYERDMLDPYGGDHRTLDSTSLDAPIGDPNFASYGTIQTAKASHAETRIPQRWSAATRRLARLYGYSARDHGPS